MEKETVSAYLNKQTRLWEVRLRETIAESKKEEAERKAKIILAAYAEAAKLISSPIQILNKAQVAECNHWIDKAGQLQAELGDSKIVIDTLRISVKNARLEEKLKHRWIPVSEGPPKETGVYLVLPHHKHCPALWYQDGWHWYDEQDDIISETIGHNSDEPIFEITHWKPIILPE